MVTVLGIIVILRGDEVVVDAVGAVRYGSGRSQPLPRTRVP